LKQVTEEKDLKSKMIINDSEGDDTTREKERKEEVVGAATAHMEDHGQFPPLELHTLESEMDPLRPCPFLRPVHRGGELCLF
jgi:hypothetical protein